MSKVLVVYGTSSGCTQGIAEHIGSALEAMGATVEVVSAKIAPAASGYDAILVGSGVRAGKWHKAAQHWVASNASTLRSVPLAFFTCCLAMREEGDIDESRGYSRPVEDANGVTPVDVGLFAGWFEPKEFSFPERTILKMMKSPEGDFRDFAAVEAWAREVAPQLGLAG